MKIADKGVIIVGAGLAGLSCARRLMDNDIPFLILEADQRVGGRLKTDTLDEFILNPFLPVSVSIPKLKPPAGCSNIFSESLPRGMSPFPAREWPPSQIN